MKIRHKFSRHTLSGKLLLLFLAMAVLFVVLVGGSLRQVFREHFQTNVRPHLIQYLDYVQQDIGLPPDHSRAKLLAEKLEIEIHIIDANGAWSSSGRYIDVDRMQIKHRIAEMGQEYILAEDDESDTEFLMVRREGVTLLFNVPHVRQEHEGFKGFFPLLVLLLILGILYHATRRLFRPIEAIQDGVRRFGAGELDYRIKVKRRDELGTLADNVNAMADDIKQMLDAKRHLLLAISHELRSPLTRAKVATELLSDESRKNEINGDLDEMEALIAEVIETERLSERHRVLNREQVDLRDLISDVLATNFAAANLKIDMPEKAVELEIDVARMKLLLKNLIDNALRYTPEDRQAPLVRVFKGAEGVVVEVRDYGDGIEAEFIPKLTEPFYRVDPARRRETGGYGLGLYLCKMIVEAHGGSLAIESKFGAGTTVRVSLPA